MKYRSILISSVLSIGLLTGCNGNVTASAEEVVSQVLDSEKDVQSYYGESIMKVYENEKLVSNIIMKEYVTQGKRKVITIDKKTKQRATAVNDGKKLISYEKGSKEALSMDMTGTELPMNQTQKEQIIKMLEALKDTHNYEVVAEEQVAGFDTYHVKLTPKKKKSIMGEMDFWVDQKNWFVVKSTMVNGDIRTETKYTKIDVSPEFSDDTFTIDLPKDVKITRMEDLNPTTTGTVEDAEKALGKPFLLLNEQEQLAKTIELNELKGEINRTEVAVIYTKEELPYLSVSIFPITKETGIELDGDKITVRGQKGEYLEEIHALIWEEQGLQYTVLFDDPNMELDEALKLLEKMKLSSNK